MQIALSIGLVIALLIALYYQRRCWKLQKILDLYFGQKKRKEIKNRAEIDLVRPIVEEYHKNIDKANAYIYMRQICDMLIKD